MAINRQTLGINTEFISVDETVDFLGAGIPTPKCAILVRENDSALFQKDGPDENSWKRFVTEKELNGLIGIITDPAELDLTTTPGVTPIFTVPEGSQCIVTDVYIACEDTITGTVQTQTLKVGTAAGSYNELVNGSSGHTFNTAAPTSLLAPSHLTHIRELYPALTMSGGAQAFFDPGDVIAADLSGTAFDTGKIVVLLIGFVIMGG